VNYIYSINYLKVIFYLCTASFFNFLGADQEINASYYDNCGTYDNNPKNDCIQDCFGIWGGNSRLMNVEFVEVAEKEIMKIVTENASLK
tara:strand:+ start:628 stop:894 length:267 start_codon:yes stop_codon:yes gene_type:complete